MAADTAGKKLSTAFGLVEVSIWAFFTLSPFLLVAGYLLYHGGASEPPPVDPPAPPPRIQTIEPYSLREAVPRDTAAVTVPSIEEKAWREYQEKLEQLRPGMKLEQVQKVLGLRFKELISAKTPAGPRITYEWELFGGYKVTGTFINDLLEKYDGM